jgi:hypothetical protein
MDAHPGRLMMTGFQSPLDEKRGSCVDGLENASVKMTLALVECSHVFGLT